jgi:hypothetical protein
MTSGSVARTGARGGSTRAVSTGVSPWSGIDGMYANSGGPSSLSDDPNQPAHP